MGGIKKYAIEMGSDTMKSFIKIGSSIQTGPGGGDSQIHKPAFIFQNKERRIKSRFELLVLQVVLRLERKKERRKEERT
jgi:hypothetical protein